MKTGEAKSIPYPLPKTTVIGNQTQTTIGTNAPAAASQTKQLTIWKTKLDAFLRFNDAEVLQDKGKVTAAIAKEFAESEFEKYRVIQDSLYESES